MPLMWLSLAFLAGVALASELSLAAWVWLLLGAGAMAVAFLGARLRRSPPLFLARLGTSLSVRSPFANLPYAVLLGIGLLGAARFAAAQPRHGPGDIDSYVNNYYTYVLEGVIEKPPDYQDSQTDLTISSQRMRLLYTSTWLQVHGQVLVTLAPGGTWHYGDLVQLQGALELPTAENSSTYRQYLAGQGIFALMSNPQAVLVKSGQGNPVLGAIYSIKEHAEAIVRLIYPDPEASLVMEATQLHHCMME